MKPKTPLLLVVILLSFSGYSFPADSTQTVPDSIESIKELSTLRDTVKTKQTIALKLKTSQPVASFTKLFIDGLEVPDVKPWRVSEADKTIFFRIDSRVQNFADEFLKTKSADKTFMPIYIGVGSTSGSRIDSSIPIYLEVKQQIKMIWVIAMICVIVLLTAVGLWNNILKDDNNLYYSLSRTQLLFWTLLCSTSYIYICFTTCSLPDLPASMLVILGISIGTTAAGKVIENNNRKGIVIDPGAKSEGWFIDILSDGSSINVQRLQNVIFNTVFGLIFLQRTISGQVMPEFDENVLLLLGISSGAYAGLKITEPAKEQKKPLPPVVADAANSIVDTRETKVNGVAQNANAVS